MAEEIISTSSLPQSEIYSSVQSYIINAQRQVYSAVNSAMVRAYWNIGKLIYETSGESDIENMVSRFCSTYLRS